MFILQIANKPEESRYKAYFSTYKRDKQIDLINLFSNKKRKLGWENGYLPFEKSNYKTTEFNYSTTYNQLGLRGKFFDSSDANKFRIIALGDSFVEGFGSPDDSTFPNLLEKELGKNVAVLNAGICGSNPINEIQLYKNKLQNIPVNLILLIINNTDVEDVEFTLHKNEIPISEYFIALSHIFRFFNAGILNNDMDTEYPNKKIVERRKKNIALMIENMKSFKEKQSKKNIDFVVVYLPLSNEINKNSEVKMPHTLYNEIIKSNLPHINLYTEYPVEQLQNTDSLNTYYWLNDCHHTPKGYDMMAKIVAQKLVKKNYLNN